MTSKFKNIALVHGGFVDGSGWHGVYGALKPFRRLAADEGARSFRLPSPRHEDSLDCEFANPSYLKICC